MNISSEEQLTAIYISLGLTFIIQIIIAIFPRLVMPDRASEKISERPKINGENALYIFSFYRSAVFHLFFNFPGFGGLFVFILSILIAIATKKITIFFFTVPLGLFPWAYYSDLYIKSFTSRIYLTRTKLIIFSRKKIKHNILLNEIVSLKYRNDAYNGIAYITFINLNNGKRKVICGLVKSTVQQINEAILAIKSSPTA